ncbi:universal stress protein [Winogradskyella litoriviva]|uniref:Universal stress protein n=1 Tax=Winogradskyella litoriviva TaxID=1220182 RepID=A0ABX2E833_9FLAO|nr:universal stress protein [Winogradskyella litoriviva]NRD24633.1 universal stress protein [Winogradskyella litoriviva]
MEHHILLPTDFSDNAWSAAIYAFQFYKEEPCTFYFLHAWKFSNSLSRTYITSNYIETLKKDANIHLKELLDLAEVSKTNPKHIFKSILSTEPLLDAVETTVKDQNIDLVIMGTKGASGVSEFLYGSNTVNIVSKMKLCPLLIIPAGYEYVKPNQVAFPTDYNHFYGEELDQIKQVCKLHNSKIRVFHINKKSNLSEKQNYNLAMLKAYLEDHKHSCHWMIDYDNKEHAIKDFIKEFDINMLTMISYKHSFFEDIIKEPVVKKIGLHPTIPFLVVPSSD